ncbi:H2A superfamily protein [Hanseniaspora osmophila]
MSIQNAIPNDKNYYKSIKTHFPAAKIKKIMQSDEDVGKLSSTTPVVSGRSLEFFIGLLIVESSKTCLKLGTKRITPDIVKKTIHENNKFDFLRDLCAADGEEEEEEEEEKEEKKNEEEEKEGA